MSGNFAGFALACALSCVGLSAYAQQSDLETAIYKSFHCDFLLHLTKTKQTQSTYNRVGALLGEARHYCVNNKEPLLDSVPASNFTYQSDGKTESKLLQLFQLQGDEIGYIDLIEVSIDNTEITEAPDNVLGAAVQFSMTDPTCQNQIYTALVARNCTAASVALTFTFGKSLTIDQINGVFKKIQEALPWFKHEPASLFEQKQSCSPSPCHVSFYLGSAPPAGSGNGSTAEQTVVRDKPPTDDKDKPPTDSAGGNGAQKFVFGWLLEKPSRYPILPNASTTSSTPAAMPGRQSNPAAQGPQTTK